MSMGSRLRFLLFAVFIYTANAVLAQVPDGSINGIVTDPKDAIVVGARVAAISTTQGISRNTVTNGSGLYVLSNMPAGTYDLIIEETGFAATEFKGFVIEAGRSITVDAKLQIASAGATVGVNGSMPDIDLTQSMIQGQITSTTIENIPLNGRNFLELAYLVPGNRPAPTFDPTKTNTLEVSSAGGFGRGGNITVDGGDNNDEVVGGTLSNFPEDSVQEFQIATGRFTAEVGRSGNSIVNIVTKSGSNQLHGSAFLFERNRNLQALPATFNRSLPTPPFDREQTGGSIGGPIKRDRAWVFGSFEYRDQNASLQTGARDFTTDSILNTSAPAPLREALVSGRFDAQLSEHNTLMVRYSYNHSTDTAEATPSQTTPSFSASERQNSLNRFNSLVASINSVLSPTRVNELSFHFDNFYNNIPPFPTNAPTTDPASLGLTNELIFPDLADGENFNLPQATRMNRYQARDGLSWSLGKHTLKLGGEFQHYAANGEINVFGTGTVILVSDFGFADLNGDGQINDLDIPLAVALHSSAPVTPVPIPHVFDNYIAGYVQDDWRVHPKLTLNLGLRWEYDSNLTGNSSEHDPCLSLTTVPARPCTWMANVINLKKTPDKKDFGPRVGFVYDLTGKGKTVVRGGYGIYYDRIILEAGAEELVQNDRALTVTQYAGSSCSNPEIPAPPSLGLCFAPGSSFAKGSPSLASPFSGPHQTGGVGILAMGPDAHHPLFQQFSLGAQQQVGKWLISADGLHVFGSRLIIGHLLRDTTSTSPYIACPGNNAPCIITDPLSGISDNITLLQSQAKSWYDGLIASVQHRPSKIGRIGYQYNISYTLSKSFDFSNDDQLTSTAAEQVDLVEGIDNLRGEKGYSVTDERHRLTLYGEAQLPWRISLAPIYTYGSGVAADTFLPGTGNINGSSGARLPLLPRNAIGREIKNSNQLNAVIDRWNALPACPAAFPCLAGGRLQNVPAGINFSSPFSALDLRLKKEIRIRDRVTLSLVGEGFNMFNETNIRGSSNTNYAGRNIAIGAYVPAQSGPPPVPAQDVQANFYSPVSTAGGFFGSGGPRAFQFAARIDF